VYVYKAYPEARGVSRRLTLGLSSEEKYLLAFENPDTLSRYCLHAATFSKKVVDALESA
jgi:hypothetical protein